MVKTIYRIFNQIKGFSLNKSYKFTFMLVVVLGYTLLSSTFSLAEFDGEATFQQQIDMSTYQFGPSQNNYYSGLVSDGTLVTKAVTYVVGTDNVNPASTADLELNKRLALSYTTRRGLYGVTSDVLAVAVNSPPSANVYAHLINEWVPGQKQDTSVYAAESGYESLLASGIAPLWEQMRNLSYVMFVIILIVIGFMIMFRQKIGGQTAVTVMNSIPNVILSLILVTFSFAISGLLINIGGVLINVITAALNLGPDQVVYMDSIVSVVKHYFTGGGADATKNAVFGFGGAISALLAGGGLNAGILGTAAAGVTAGGLLLGGIALAGVISGLVVLVIVGTVVWASIKVFMTLMRSYASILLDTIIAPIYLTISAIPGKENMRGDWFRRMLKNILVFPLVFAIVNLGTFILNQDLTLSFPGILVGSDLNTEVAPIMMLIVTRIFVIYLYFLAAQAPKLLEDFFPQAGGKSMAEAFKGAAQGIPFIGGLVGK